MKIVMIGAGKVATRLGASLKKAKHEFVAVYSRSASSAHSLAEKLKCKSVTDIHALPATADVYVVCISDHAIKKVLKDLSVKNKIIIHTSGSVSLKVFGKKFKNYGVIYPLQTFSKERDLILREVPLLVEANNPKTQAVLFSLAGSISKFVFQMDSSERKTVHLAAVIANNFTNYLFILAEKILAQKDLPFALLGPLLQETVMKAVSLGPSASQTGPAKRGDTETMEGHLQMLKNDPALQKIYRLLSEHIERESGLKL